MNKPRPKAIIPKAQLARMKELRAKARKVNARRRAIRRYCEIKPGENLGGYCPYSRILAGEKVCITIAPAKKIDELKACPKPPSPSRRGQG